MQTPDNEPQPFETPNPPNNFPANVPPNAPRKKSPLKMIGLGCGGVLALLIALVALMPDDPAKKPTTTSQSSTGTNTATGDQGASDLSKYWGQWTGQDGTTISIRGDGKGDFNGGNLKVQGGGVEVDNTAKTLKISSFFGIGKEWKIDQAPHSSNGASEMKLSGVVYRRTSGFNPDDSSSTKTTSSTGSSFDETKVPSNVDAVRLTKTTLLDFDSAVAKNSFSGFHSRISQLWQNQISAPELTKIFQPFVLQKIRLNNAVNDLSPTFSPAPSIDKSGILTLQGFYPSKPSRLTFRLRFVPEDNAWKLIGIRVNVVPQN